MKLSFKQTSPIHNLITLTLFLILPIIYFVCLTDRSLVSMVLTPFCIVVCESACLGNAWEKYFRSRRGRFVKVLWPSFLAWYEVQSALFQCQIFIDSINSVFVISECSGVWNIFPGPCDTGWLVVSIVLLQKVDASQQKAQSSLAPWCDGCDSAVLLCSISCTGSWFFRCCMFPFHPTHSSVNQLQVRNCINACRFAISDRCTRRCNHWRVRGAVPCRFVGYEKDWLLGQFCKMVVCEDKLVQLLAWMKHWADGLGFQLY